MKERGSLKEKRKTGRKIERERVRVGRHRETMRVMGKTKSDVKSKREAMFLCLCARA